MEANTLSSFTELAAPNPASGHREFLVTNLRQDVDNLRGADKVRRLQFCLSTASASEAKPHGNDLMSLRPPRKTAIRLALLSLTSAASCVVVSSQAQAGCGHPSRPDRAGQVAASADSLEILKIGTVKALGQASKTRPGRRRRASHARGLIARTGPFPPRRRSAHPSFKARNGAFPWEPAAPLAIAAACRLAADSHFASTHFTPSIERPPRG